jgi:hypothetical protein
VDDIDASILILWFETRARWDELKYELTGDVEIAALSPIYRIELEYLADFVCALGYERRHLAVLVEVDVCRLSQS